MRSAIVIFLIVIFLSVFIGFSCVKPKTTDPIPKLTFKQMQGDAVEAGSESAAVWPTNKPVSKKLYTSHINNSDTALLVIGFTDGDGDLFRDSKNDGANLVYTTYAYDAATQEFKINGNPNPATVVQPAEGYYKGKSIQGEIGIPLPDFRLNNVKIIKLEVFMIDVQNHKTNVVSSPVYTLAP